MARYLIDTTFVVDYLRALPAAVERFARSMSDGDEVFVNEIVICEAAFGAPTHPDPDLMALLEPLEFIQPGPEHVLLAGQWRAEARGRGRTLSLPDSLVAAAAVALDAIVLTRNERDFALTPVRVESY